MIGGAESDPPTLTSFSMDKTSVDVGESDQIVSFTVEAEDESGVDWSNPSTMIEFNDPSGKSHYINFSLEAPHIASYTFTSESKAGVWRVGYIRLIDTLDNRVSFYASSLGSNTSVEIAGLDTDTDGINDCEDIDDDGDGMPDEWETRYGLDPNDPSDAASDRDNDGITALDEFLTGTIPLGSLDIDGNTQYDALTDGLLLLRKMFGLSDDALITGTVAFDAAYTESEDIESRIRILGSLADIDGSGDIDALTDGLLVLRYLFGLEGDTLINGVVATDATRKTAEEIESHLDALIFIPEPEADGPVISNVELSTSAIDFSEQSSYDLQVNWRTQDYSGVDDSFCCDRIYLRKVTGFGGDRSWTFDDLGAFRVSGDSLYGQYQATITLNAADHPPTAYELVVREIGDVWGNFSNQAEVPLEIINVNSESDGPVISNVELSTSVIDFSEQSSYDLQVNWTVEDDSGVDDSFCCDRIYLRKVTGFGGDRSWTFDDLGAFRVSGDSLYGQYQATITLNAADHPPTAYELVVREIGDVWGNFSNQAEVPLEIINSN